MLPLVVFDGRDGASVELRGWGRYAQRLVGALRDGAVADALLFELRVLDRGGPGPEVLFEQVKLPLALRRARASLVHAPNCFLPLVRPCPGVVTIHDLAFEAWPADFGFATGLKYRTLSRLAARSAERVICDSSFTRDDLVSRYGVDASKVRVVALAPALIVCMGRQETVALQAATSSARGSSRIPGTWW